MAFNTFQKLSILAVIVSLLLSHNLYEVSAATGGRMGGSSFSEESPPSSNRYDDHHYYDHHHDHHRYHHHHHHHSQPGLSTNADQETSSTPAAVSYLIITIFAGVASAMVYSSAVQSRMSVLQVQVGLSAKARSVQKELTEIASTTDTSTSKGWNFILQETISSLLHHPHCYLHGYSSVTHHWSIGGAEQQFQRLSKEERLKFDVETLINVNNNKVQRVIVSNGDDTNKDRIVVTVLVAAKGVQKLPAINTTDNVKEALQSLADISSSKIKGVEVLWSPQDENDSLSVEELLENYPQLKRI
ncbi:Fluctuating-Light- Acclimation Protein1 [Hibiscus trionum]|uniref:Fluctuating-Light- Acclimation Protein1 n=1 Tax=Hibiscus trionum TaxID=183268 RepID=A0A9W7IT79_HIBTR|nr:Fluctuating-Light- Acclimation Protein1 [Hibiscus trionum]